ncbi:glycosyltransferase involved in cell wall biosynthesis [Frondihabitans sp. PhB188]|uniref:glycosyltransferase n=1 Tax=Frondihabitans sp. PhB188 TaxID=2485200 RepID=UPI000F47D6B4|nr:glycosyltransferase [Frondihabitans sp. PhB188]ROQ41169.1 glycosyltransferase involved in cell wall biosynthesis [Frondihabitans sp. PhB188]
MTHDTAPGDSPAPSTVTPQRPLRVLLAGDTFPPDVNGAANFTERLAVGLAGRGHDVHVVAPAATRKHGTFREEHDGQVLTVHRLNSTRWPLHDWLRFATPWTVKFHSRRIVESFKPDVVHIQAHIIIGRGLTKVAHDRGIRIIATNHFMPDNLVDHFPPMPKRLKDWIVTKAWQDAAHTYEYVQEITTPTKKAAGFLEAATNITGVYAISCGIDASDYTAKPGRPKDNTIVFVGRVTGEKHIDVLLQAMTKLSPTLDAKLVIVGGGDLLGRLTQMTADLGLADRVTFAGYLSDDELRRTLTDATVFCMPSTAELQSIASLEAMASGLPIVVADAMALPHLVDDGSNGYLFRPGDADDLAEKLTLVLEKSDANYVAMRTASLKMIEPHDIGRTLDTFEKLYRGQAVADPVADTARASQTESSSSS